MSPHCIAASEASGTDGVVIRTLLARKGVQTWAWERLLYNHVLLPFSFTPESPIKAPPITEAHEPDIVNQSLCESPGGARPGDQRKEPDPGCQPTSPIPQSAQRSYTISSLPFSGGQCPQRTKTEHPAVHIISPGAGHVSHAPPPGGWHRVYFPVLEASTPGQAIAGSVPGCRPHPRTLRPRCFPPASSQSIQTPCFPSLQLSSNSEPAAWCQP